MGGSNEFFDKFSVRYHISVILRHLWNMMEHRQTFIKESRLIHYLYIISCDIYKVIHYQYIISCDMYKVKYVNSISIYNNVM